MSFGALSGPMLEKFIKRELRKIYTIAVAETDAHEKDCEELGLTPNTYLCSGEKYIDSLYTYITDNFEVKK